MRINTITCMALALIGASCDHTAKEGFVSDNNRCFPSSEEATVSLEDPLNIPLSLSDGTYPTHAQRITPSEDIDIYGIKMRLISTNESPLINIDVITELDSGDEAEAGITITLPNGLPGQLVTHGTMTTTTLSDALKWAEFKLLEPITLSAGKSYWFRVFPMSSGVSWTATNGAGYASRDGARWTVLNNRQGAYQYIECAALEDL